MFINLSLLSFVFKGSTDRNVHKLQFHPVVSRIRTCNRISRTSISLMSASKVSDKAHESDHISIDNLCRSLGATPEGQLNLRSSKGERGIFLNRGVDNDDVILRIPINSCVRDDTPPHWYDQGHDDGIDEKSHPYNPSKWAIHLAASLIDLDLCATEGSDNKDILYAKKQWLEMMPDPEYLRASIPIHWNEEILSSAKCTALEIANDATYFARADAVADLQGALESSEANELIKGIDFDVASLCNNALDLVQTRCCRVERIDGIQVHPPLRIVAPIFDFINHGSSQYVGEGSSNAYFGLEGESDDRALVVRARRSIKANQQILIDYGDSARPSWRSLASYGFIPAYSILGPDEEPSVGANECVAEVFYNGVRYEVSSHSVPKELVEAACASYLEEEEETRTLAMADDIDEGSRNMFPPEVALRLAKIMSDASFDLSINDSDSNESNNMENEDDKFDPDSIANNLVVSLRWTQNQVLLTCALGLRDYAAREDAST